jgi:hypothetical protein
LALTVAKRAVAGKPISRRNVEQALRALLGTNDDVPLCALDGCNERISRPNATYCGAAHAGLAYRQRRRKRDAAAFEGPTCARCGAIMFGAADGGHGLCVECDQDGEDP